jgi:acyl carrier protein
MILEKLKNILQENTEIKDVKITELTNLRTDLGLTSLDLAELACIVEDEFDVEISNRTITTLKTIGDVISFIENN